MLYAVNAHDCWIICREPVPSLFEAMEDRNYVGTWLSPEPPETWDGEDGSQTRIFICELCGGDGGWGPEHQGQSHLTCSACNGEGEYEAEVEGLDEQDLFEDFEQ